MARKELIFLAFGLMFLALSASGTNMINVPQTMVQPNGTVIHCYLSGDEYYTWLHDGNNYTILQDPTTGYYCYAILQNDKLIASKYVVGVDDPLSSGLQPGIQISQDEIMRIRNQFLMDVTDSPELEIKSAQLNAVRTLNNLVVYVRFSDQAEFEPKQAIYSGYFNSADSGANSMYNYFYEASYQKLKIVSTFYPLNDGVHISSYKDSHIRMYYCPLTAKNDSGYSVTDGGTMKKNREWKLVSNAVKFIKRQIPSTLDLDTNQDGKVDNVCFIIRDDTLSQNIKLSTLLCPHTWKSFYSVDSLNSKLVCCYNIQPACYLDHLQTGALCHEMFHSLGATDLYCNNLKFDPLGTWDVMSYTTNPPTSMCAANKYRFGGWIDAIPEITTTGHYTLNPITMAQNNCYKIHSSDREYFVLEFRQKTGTFENSLPGTGLIIYLWNKSACCQNIGGPPNWLYIFRPGGTSTSNGSINDAFFDTSVGRSSFNNETNPACQFSNGSPGNISVENIKVSGNTVSFDVRFYEIIYNNTNQLPPFSDAVNRIETRNSVIVKNSDRVVFDAGQEILLNPGFEVEPGGQFETNTCSSGNP